MHERYFDSQHPQSNAELFLYAVGWGIIINRLFTGKKLPPTSPPYDVYEDAKRTADLCHAISEAEYTRNAHIIWEELNDIANKAFGDKS